MNKLITILSGILLSSNAVALTEVTIYGDDDNPPYSFTEANGKVAGIYAEIISATTEKMSDYKVTLKPIPWMRGLKMLETGSGFALFPPYLKTERTYIEYSNPLLTEQISLYCSEKVLKKARTIFPDDFKGLRIGVNAGFLLTDSFNRARTEKIFKVEESKSNETNILKILSERIDCYAVPSLSVVHTIRDLKYRKIIPDRFRILKAYEFEPEVGYLGFTTKGQKNFPYKDDFIKKFNQNFEALVKDGTIAAIKYKYE